MSDIELIKELRDATGLSFKEIGEALGEAGGDKARAIEVLKAHGAALAQKKASRETQEGVIDAYIHATKKIGALVELLCETDFVARSREFQALGKELALQVASMDAKTPAKLLKQAYVRDAGKTIADLISEVAVKVKEKIVVAEIARMKV